MFSSYEVDCDSVSFICEWVGFSCMVGCDSFIYAGVDI